MKFYSLLLLLTASFAITLSAQSAPRTEASWHQLKEQVAQKIAELNIEITQAKEKGLVTEYALVSRQVIAAFQVGAQHDRDHIERIRKIFKGFPYSKETDPAAAEKLPFDQMHACLEVANYAIEELQQQRKDELTLAPSPNFEKGTITKGKGYYLRNQKIAFPYTLVWLPTTDAMGDALGRIANITLAPSFLNENGSLNPRQMKRTLDSLRSQSAANFTPLTVFLANIPARWMLKKHPEIGIGARKFVQFDIDNPLVRKWLETLCAKALPQYGKVYGDKPMIHMIANEPHFGTRKGGWLVKNGLSPFTFEKYRMWLEKKYRTIETLNELYDAAYSDFSEITITFPVAPALRGGAVWYDWCRFNMDRGNEWFTFLKEQVQKNDGRNAPVTIKLLGHHLNDRYRDHGIDIEYLTNLQEVLGGDLRVVPRDATFYGKAEGGHHAKNSWRSRYAYDWMSQSMYLDFTKSLCPDKPYYDTEWHGFGAVSWRHFKLKRDYVRSALWLTFTHGVGAIKPWLWGRASDGSLKTNANQIGELTTQPIAVDAYGRVMKELNAHASAVAGSVPSERRFRIFYCEESAVQDGTYADNLAKSYEALKLLNIGVGFTTPSTISSMDPKRHLVIVPPTSFISDSNLKSLHDFKKRGGQIIAVQAEKSFKKDEYGRSRKNVNSLTTSSIPLGEAVKMSTQFRSTIKSFGAEFPKNIKIADTSDVEAYGVFVQKTKDPESGKLVYVLNNVSKDSRLVTIQGEDQTQSFIDQLTGKALKNPILMPSCSVRMVIATK